MAKKVKTTNLRPKGRRGVKEAEAEAERRRTEARRAVKTAESRA